MSETLEVLKCDIRAFVEAAVFTTEMNRRDSLQYITSEYHTVPASPPHRVRLDEVPDRDSGLVIAGYTETQSLPSLQGQFFVDWIMGYVWFHSSDRGKIVNPRYFGKGSLIDAEDINKITQELTHARQVTQRLRPSAGSVSGGPDRSLRIDKGSFLIGSTEVTYLGNTNIRLGPGGEFETSALSLGHYNKILFTLDPTGRLKKYEGVPGATASSALAPSIPQGEMPVCIVTVQDDGTGGAGTIKNIQASDIKDIRTFLQAPGIEHRYLTIYHEGVPTSGEIFFDGFYFAESVTIDRVSIHARSAPRGSSLQIDLMKNGSATGRIATLPQDTLSGSTAVTPISFTFTDKLGLKVTAVDSQELVEGITVVISYL
ncbi:MAG TPA: hypothetical protein ACFYD1_03525 [Candidatus Hypogeohydataceae bacterium YC38]